MSLGFVKSVVTVSALAASLAACGTGGSLTPDEFEVMQYRPLAVPPESELSPPRPGQPQAQEIDAGRRAFEALYPGKTFSPTPKKSDGEQSLISGIGESEPDIRSSLMQVDTAHVVKKSLLIGDILDAEERQFRPDNIVIRRVASTNNR